MLKTWSRSVLFEGSDILASSNIKRCTLCRLCGIDAFKTGPYASDVKSRDATRRVNERQAVSDDLIRESSSDIRDTFAIHIPLLDTTHNPPS